ncbi:MAG: sulfite exporter TauE/SafE family protein [Chloroflexota bacterium]|nr:sulfite exporter TauE/SafE family protein [Chloroflexota bacterium]
MGALDLLILTAGLAVAGFAKGATAMGLPLVATPILAGVFGPRPAVVIISIPILVANSILLVQGGRAVGVLRSIVPMLVAGALGTVGGVLLLAQLDQRVFALLIAALVIVFLLRGDRLLGDDPDARRVRLLGPVISLLAGVLQGSTSIASPLIGSYFHARRLSPGDYVLVLAAIFQLNSIVQVIGFILLGLYTPTLLAVAFLGLIPTLLALLAGIFARGRMSPARFRQAIAVLLIASVANLLWRTFIA